MAASVNAWQTILGAGLGRGGSVLERAGLAHAAGATRLAQNIQRHVTRTDVPHPAGRTVASRLRFADVVGRSYARSLSQQQLQHGLSPSFFSSTSSLRLPEASHLSQLRPLSRLRYSSSAGPSATASSSATADAEPEDTSMKGRLKSLMKKYGWATVAVYLLFSVVDFSLVFFAINLLGADHVRKGQDYVLDALVYGTEGSRKIGDDGTVEARGLLSFLKDWREKHKQVDKENAKDAKKGGSGSLWATAALAYTIHKIPMLPVRLAATAAATPAIVK